MHFLNYLQFMSWAMAWLKSSSHKQSPQLKLNIQPHGEPCKYALLFETDLLEFSVDLKEIIADGFYEKQSRYIHTSLNLLVLQTQKKFKNRGNSKHQK